MTMREILFRGKRRDRNVWIYGGIRKVGGCYEIDDEHGPRETVLRDTIGQFTGLTDKNGTKIFEGDILSTHFDFNYPEVESRTVVEWGNFRWVTHQPGYEPDDITDFDKGLWTVIGNVHDNPELIGGELHG